MPISTTNTLKSKEAYIIALEKLHESRAMLSNVKFKIEQCALRIQSLEESELRLERTIRELEPVVYRMQTDLLPKGPTGWAWLEKKLGIR